MSLLEVHEILDTKAAGEGGEENAHLRRKLQPATSKSACQPILASTSGELGGPQARFYSIAPAQNNRGFTNSLLGTHGYTAAARLLNALPLSTKSQIPQADNRP